MKKYPSIERLGHEENSCMKDYLDDNIYITEKVDGGNGSFFVDENGLVHECSKNRDLITEGSNEKTFIKERLALRNVLKGKELNPDYYYYIEWMKKHTLRYVNVPPVIGYDILLATGEYGGADLFLNDGVMRKEFERLEIPVVQLVNKMKVKDFLKQDINDFIKKSAYADFLMEGIVGKVYGRKNQWGRQIMFKVVREEFKEQNAIVFGSIKSSKVEDTEKIVQQFCTDARIRKIVLKLVNEESLILSRSLMSRVPSEVIKDILKEEFTGIYENYKSIDFKVMKQLVPKRCLKVIDELLMNNVK